MVLRTEVYAVAALAGAFGRIPGIIQAAISAGTGAKGAIGGILSSSPGMAGAVVAGHSTLDVVATGSDLVLKHRSWRR